MAAMDYFNQEPVVHTWAYKLDKAARYDSNFENAGLGEPSVYAPRAASEAPEPAWKGFKDFKDYVHPRQSTFKG
jgi:hypothetical protein